MKPKLEVDEMTDKKEPEIECSYCRAFNHRKTCKFKGYTKCSNPFCEKKMNEGDTVFCMEGAGDHFCSRRCALKNILFQYKLVLKKSKWVKP